MLEMAKFVPRPLHNALIRCILRVMIFGMQNIGTSIQNACLVNGPVEKHFSEVLVTVQEIPYWWSPSGPVGSGRKTPVWLFIDNE